MFPFKEYPGLVVRGMVVDEIVYASGSRYIRPSVDTNSEKKVRYSVERMQRTAEKVREWEEEAMGTSRYKDPYTGIAPWEGGTRREIF